MSESRESLALLDAIESVASDAWRECSQEHAAELWRCIWEGGDGELGATWVAPSTVQRIRYLSESEDRWWVWTMSGEPFAMSLAGAQAMFREGVPEMSDAAAAAYLRELRGALDEVGKRAVDRAIAALVKG